MGADYLFGTSCLYAVQQRVPIAMITQHKTLPLLDKWLGSEYSFGDFQKSVIEELKGKLLENADFWNEDELKLQFIAPLLQIIKYDELPGCKVFSQRMLSATINNVSLGGRVDLLIAKGKQKPTEPYFFIHEYKQETKKGSSDPKGQLLAELVTAQFNNEHRFPLYGCYVVGRMWFFLVLEGKSYAVSNAFNASDNDIYNIVSILMESKSNILSLVQNQNKK